MFARTTLGAALAMMLVTFSAGSADAQAVQYRESDFDFVSLRTYEPAREALSAWVAQTIDVVVVGDPIWPADVRAAYRALVEEAAANGFTDVDAIWDRLVYDITGGEQGSARVEGWDGTYKGGPPRNSAADRRDLDSDGDTLSQDDQRESRRFQRLSDMSKAAHDIAMNSIRNMK